MVGSGAGLLTRRALQMLSDPGGGLQDLLPASPADVSGSAGQAVLLREEIRVEMEHL